MQNEKEKIKNGETPEGRWQFWFLVSFSLLLVVTFVFYLPTRFERNFLRDELGHMAGMPHEEMEEMEGMKEMHDDGGHGETRYHEEGEVTEGLAVNFNVVPAAPLVSAPAELQFFVNEKPGNVPVPDSSLQVDHEKLMHVIGVRSDMNEFFHIHPEPAAGKGLFAVPYSFAKPGLYKVWSEIKKDDTLHVFGHPPITIEGEGERETKRVSFERKIRVGEYEVSLILDEPVEKGHNHMLSFDIHTGDGQKVEVEDYLAVPMHLSIIKDDWTHLIHAHPEGDDHAKIPARFGAIPVAQAHGPVEESTQPEGDIRFQVTFPKAGLYKLFAQFRPAGIDLPKDEAVLATFWVQVQEASTATRADDHPHAPGTPEDHHESTQLQPLVSPAWWLLLVVSLGLIGLLSFAIHKFITVKK